MTNSFIDSKFYKILRAVLNIGLWLAVGASLICFFLLLFKPEMVSEMVFDGISFNGIDDFESTFSKIVFLISNDLMMLSGILGLLMLRNVVNSLKSGSPFSRDNVKRIRILGWSLFAMAYFKQTACLITVDRISQTLSEKGMDSLIQAQFQLLPDGVVLAVCVLLLAEIFRYGCMLQTEHDSTV